MTIWTKLKTLLNNPPVPAHRLEPPLPWPEPSPPPAQAADHQERHCSTCPLLSYEAPQPPQLDFVIQQGAPIRVEVVKGGEPFTILVGVLVFSVKETDKIEDNGMPKFEIRANLVVDVQKGHGIIEGAVCDRTIANERTRDETDQTNSF
jgi:hypothetical protein